MASKGKGKSKLRKDEIKFQNKRIDVKRFAYDVLKYTTAKFGLPEHCISVWEGPENDYECDDFCLVVCREIIRYQIRTRYNCFTSFDRRRKSNKLASFDLVGRLLQDVMYEEMAGPLFEILDKVEISLSVLGELVLYLYTNNIDLYLKQLINHWFDCHLNIKKKSFETAGGLTQLYLRNRKPKFDRYDNFHNIFIKNFCLPYKDTANNPNLVDMYDKSYASRIQKAAESLPPKDPKDVKRELMRGGEIVIRQSERKGFKLKLEIEEEAIPAPPEPDEATGIESDEDSGVNIPQNTGLGIPEHHELYGVGGPLGAVVAPTSQGIPGASPEELPQFGRNPSAKEKMQMKKAGLCPFLAGRHRIPEHHEMHGMGGPLGATAALATQDIPEARPEEQPQRGRKPSAKEKKQMRKAGLCPSMEDRPRIPEHHEMYGAGGPLGATAAPAAQDIPEASPEEQPQRDRKLSAKEMMKAGLCPSMEERLGMPEHKGYGIVGPLRIVLPTSQDLSVSRPDEQSLLGGRLSAKEEMEMRKASFRPSLDQDLGILERQELHGVGVPLGAAVPPSQDISEASPQEQPQSGGEISTEERLKMRRELILQRLRQRVGQLGLDPSKPKPST